MDQITEAFSRHIRTLYKEQDPGVVVDFNTRLNFYYKNKLLPFLHSHTRKDGYRGNTDNIRHIEGVRKRDLDHLEGVITLEDLGKEIHGFEYCQRKLGLNNRNAKVLELR